MPDGRSGPDNGRMTPATKLFVAVGAIAAALAVALGFLSLSVLSQLLGETIEFDGRRMGVNYGVNRLRFTGPVRAGTRVRARFTLAGVEPLEGGAQTSWQVTVEREGETKPALVAEWLIRHYV